MMRSVTKKTPVLMVKLASTSFKVFAFAALCFAVAQPADAGAVRGGLFDSSTLARNDDGSTGLVGIGFDTNFFGTTYNQLFVNNNGNATFDSPLGTFTPFPIATTETVIIAPFFADVDTRNLASNEVTYGTGTIDGRNAFGINWLGVGYFPSAADKLNSFQLALIDRSDIGAGNFDIEFNYDQILWETGGASGGTDGLGGFSARTGYSDGLGNSFELPGSAVNGAFLDGGPNSLVANRLNSDVDGRYLFAVRNGVVIPPTDVPTPALLPGLLGLGVAALRKRKGEGSEAEKETVGVKA